MENKKHNNKKLPRYYWMKLGKTFFDKPEIKKLRKLAGGDTYIVIYLRMMLLVIDSGGVYEFLGYENSISEELSLILGEEQKNVEVVINFLIKYNLLITNFEQNQSMCLFTDVVNNIGKETTDAIRKREKKKLEIEMRKNSGNFPENGGNFPIEKEQEQETKQEIDKEQENSTYQVVVTEENIYKYLDDEQSKALNELIVMAGTNIIKSDKDSVIKYFVKLCKRQFKDSKGEPINDLVKYVCSNFNYKTMNDSYEEEPNNRKW